MLEFESLKKLRTLQKKIPQGFVGPGDDCAFIPWTRNELLAVSCDSLAEGVHFYKDCDLKTLLSKTLQVNLSDLAAKGAKPLACFFSVSVPPRLAPKLNFIHKTFSKFCEKEGILLLGGDTTGSESGLFLSLTVLGRVPKKNLKLRAQAKEGELVCVIGNLGDSAAGFELLRKKVTPSSQNKKASLLIEKHLSPRAKTQEGQFLAAQKSVGAMMDLSDGLASDLQRILEMSGKGCQILVDSLPLSSEILSLEKFLKKKALTYALEGGEDYTLLFTVKKKDFHSLKKVFENKFNDQIHCIGVMSSQKRVEFLDAQGKALKNLSSFDHFAHRK